jgi:hypothetical protein
MAKYLDGIQVTEVRADNTPRLIGSIDYSEFTASSTKYKSFNAVLNRSARKRTITFQSTLNQPLSGNILITPYESSVPNFAGLKNSALATSNATLVANGQLSIGGDYQPIMNTAIDSLSIAFPMGATSPTSGKIDIYIVEGF